MWNPAQKQTPPYALILWIGLLEVAYYTFKKLHGIHTDTFTASYLLLTDDLPTLLLFILAIYGLVVSSAHRTAKILLVIFGVMELGETLVTFFQLVGRDHLYVREILRNWTVPQFILEINFEGLCHELFFGAIGWSFMKKTPFYFDYPEPNPLQGLIIKFIGFLWILYTTMHFVDHVFSLIAKINNLV